MDNRDRGEGYALPNAAQASPIRSMTIDWTKYVRKACPELKLCYQIATGSKHCLMTYNPDPTISAGISGGKGYDYRNPIIVEGDKQYQAIDVFQTAQIWNHRSWQANIPLIPSRGGSHAPCPACDLDDSVPDGGCGGGRRAVGRCARGLRAPGLCDCFEARAAIGRTGERRCATEALSHR